MPSVIEAGNEQSRRQQFLFAAVLWNRLVERIQISSGMLTDAGERDGIGKIHRVHWRPQAGLDAETSDIELSSSTNRESNEMKNEQYLTLARVKPVPSRTA